MAMRAGIRHHGRCAKGAFGGVNVGIEFNLRRAIRTGRNPCLFHGRLGEFFRERLTQIKLGQGTAAQSRLFDWIDMAAMIANELTCSGIIPKVSTAIVAGKSVLFCHKPHPETPLAAPYRFEIEREGL